MTPITNLIRELRELGAKATPGPWLPIPGWDGGIMKEDGANIARFYFGDGLHASEDAFITIAMRNALPRLLDRIEKLERVAEAARKLHAECPYEVDHSGRCDRNTNNRTTKLCECGTDDWVTADEAISSALDALEEE